METSVVGMRRFLKVSTWATGLCLGMVAVCAIMFGYFTCTGDTRAGICIICAMMLIIPSSLGVVVSQGTKDDIDNAVFRHSLLSMANKPIQVSLSLARERGEPTATSISQVST